MKIKLSVSLVLAAGLVACGGSKKTEEPVAAAPVAEAVAAAEAVEEAPPPPPAPEPVLSYAEMATPESVYYDEKNDVYIVSNMNGGPTDVDNNGFISKLAPDGTVTTLKWIEGGKNKVTLNAPRGVAIANDTLYVADIDTVRLFNAKTGAAKGAIKIPGASFLNDMVAGADGRVYVTDTGMAPGEGAPTQTGTDAVYVIAKNKKVTTLAKTTDLGGPNGLALADGKLWVVSYFTGELYSLDPKAPSAKADTQKLPKGGLDGLVSTPSGILVSSWELGGVLKGSAGSEFASLLDQINASADIGFDSKRNRILVPRMINNTLEVYAMPE